jgi:BirA family biotin operon repressor/biotin-[acetyl-CoA-carboxylase] ligase
MFVVQTDFQSSGKGQLGNSWESENAKNLLFSFLLKPSYIAIDKQFVVSQMISLAIKKVLNQYADGFSIKWPNDIYWNDRKIAGILIENSLQGNRIKWMIVGVGLNVNQECFISNAPNPVSLLNIVGEVLSTNEILENILTVFEQLYRTNDIEKIREEYIENLYRGSGFHKFKADNQVFDAQITTVFTDGQLELETTNDEILKFYFKEVEFVI